MNIETILGVALVVISIGNYILYTGLRNKITLLEEIVTSNDKERDLWVKLMGRQTNRLKKLEDKCKYSEKQAMMAVAMELLESSDCDKNYKTK